jgi:hypothetical protein
MPKEVGVSASRFESLRDHSRIVGKPSVILGPWIKSQLAPSPGKSCRFNRSMQHHLIDRSGNTSLGESVCTAAVNQNLNRAFVLVDLVPANETSLIGLLKKTLTKCCIDPSRPLVLPETGPLLTRFAPALAHAQTPSIPPQPLLQPKTLRARMRAPDRPVRS